MRTLLALTEDADFVCYRYRLAAFRPALEAAGWTLKPMPRPRTARGFAAMLQAMRAADAVVVQRRLYSVAKAWLIRRASHVLLFDFDDAVHMRDSNQHRASADTIRHGRFSRLLRMADASLAGSAHLREEAAACAPGATVHLMPTCVDPTRYPVARHDRPAGDVTLVWIGSPSTAHSLDEARPGLQAAATATTRLHLICDGVPRDVGIPARHTPWSADTEVHDLAAADIGIAWLPDHPWSAGKCGLKVLQYMAAGLPVICNAVGIHRQFVAHGRTGFLVDTPAAWREAVAAVAADPTLRRAMGAEGRARVTEGWSVEHWAPRFVEILERAARRAAPPRRSAA